MNTIANDENIGKANTGKETRGLMNKLLNTRPCSTSLAVLILAAGLLVAPHAALAAPVDKDQPQQTAAAQSRETSADGRVSIAITAPGNNAVQIYPAPFGVTATATFPGKADGRNDQRQGVETQFFASGQQFAESENAPYQATFTPPHPGIYTLTAQLRFGEGKRTILSGPVTVIADVPPTVNLTAPADNSIVVTPANVTLTASASSQIGSIAQVDFYAATTSNGITTNALLGSATTGTGGVYSYAWANAPVGKYTLTAVATDEWGISSTSAPVTLTVRPGELRPYYIHTDQIDSPREITDTSGNVAWQWDNADPFGNNVPNENPSSQGAFHFNLRFPGQYYDTETNLAYNVNRDYDAAIGRYVESDPIGLDGGVNTYAYVEGNPLIWIDPLGLADANTFTYGEIGSYSVTSVRNFTPPPGLPDAKASIGAACTATTCNSVDGSHATAPADRAAWDNIVNAHGGTDRSGGGRYMCVGTQSCWFVHSNYTCRNHRKVLAPRQTPLFPSGTCTVGGHSLYFYSDPLQGWDTPEHYRSGCRGR